MKALIIVDMLRGFMEPGFPLYCGGEAREIIPKVVAVAESAVESNTKVFHLRDRHRPYHPEMKIFPPHCMIGTVEANEIDELYGLYPFDIPKTTIDGFYKTILDDSIGCYKETVVVGVCTDICIFMLVMGLLIRGHKVIVLSDCVASFDKGKHEFMLKHMADLGAIVIASNDLTW